MGLLKSISAVVILGTLLLAGQGLADGYADGGSGDAPPPRPGTQGVCHYC
ncbi:MAG: hypothetical protein U0Z75_03070 [Deinococcaceae bacterium]